FDVFEASKRPNADGMGITRNFRSVRDEGPDGSKNANLSYSHAGLDAWTDRNSENGSANGLDQEKSIIGGPAKDDPWADLDIPPYLDRRPKWPNPPALGPPGDSLDDFR